MNILLASILGCIMTTGMSAQEMQHVPRHEKRRGSIITEQPKHKKRDLGDSDKDKKHQASKPIIIPPRRTDNLRILERRLSTTDKINPLVIHLPPQEEEPVDMSVVNLRGQMEAQQASQRYAQPGDTGRRERKSWCDEIMAMCAGYRRRNDPLAPPPLVRQYSYYPGRLSPEPMSPEPGSSYTTNQELR